MSQFRCPDPIPNAPISNHANWEIRLEENEFLLWRSKLKKSILFFYGASKGNPGLVGGGGVLLSDENSILATYAWGLGSMSNNKAEALAFWQGLKQAQERNLKSLVVFGDSKLIIQALGSKNLSTNIFLISILKKILLLVSNWDISFFHVLCGLNEQADLEANKAALLGRSILVVNGRESQCNIP